MAIESRGQVVTALPALIEAARRRGLMAQDVYADRGKAIGGAISAWNNRNAKEEEEEKKRREREASASLYGGLLGDTEPAAQGADMSAQIAGAAMGQPMLGAAAGAMSGEAMREQSPIDMSKLSQLDPVAQARFANAALAYQRENRVAGQGQRALNLQEGAQNYRRFREEQADEMSLRIAEAARNVTQPVSEPTTQMVTNPVTGQPMPITVMSQRPPTVVEMEERYEQGMSQLLQQGAGGKQISAYMETVKESVNLFRQMKEQSAPEAPLAPELARAYEKQHGLPAGSLEGKTEKWAKTMLGVLGSPPGEATPAKSLADKVAEREALAAASARGTASAKGEEPTLTGKLTEVQRSRIRSLRDMIRRQDKKISEEMDPDQRRRLEQVRGEYQQEIDAIHDAAEDGPLPTTEESFTGKHPSGATPDQVKKLEAAGFRWTGDGWAK